MRSVDLRLDRIGKAPAPCGARPSRNLRSDESASNWIILSFKDQHLCRRLMPRPKFGRSGPTTAAAAPATFRLVHLQVVVREQVPIAADDGYGDGLEDTILGKGHRISFGCSKARPRYHLQRVCTVVHRIAASDRPSSQLTPSDGAGSRVGESLHQFTKADSGHAIGHWP